MTTRGYFSLIQYVPDLGRAEAANVGVLVFSNEGVPVVRLSETNDTPKRRFGAETISEEHLDAAKTALRNRLLHYAKEHTLTCEAVVSFSKTLGNSLRMTTPKPVAVENATATAALLLEALVEVEPLHRHRVEKPRLEPVVDALEHDGVPIKKNAILKIPTTEEDLTSAFAYLNGSLNYVTAQGFAADRKHAVRLAEQLGFKGRCANEKLKQSNYATKLIVVASFQKEAVREVVTRVLEECKVAVVPVEELEAFQLQVKREAKHDGLLHLHS